MNIKSNSRVWPRILVVIGLVCQAILYMDPVATAATLTSASIQMVDGRPSQSTQYLVSASGFSAATTIQCVEVDLDTQADGGGSNPSGLTTSSSTFDSSSLLTAALWAVDNTTNGTLRITSAVGETPAANGNIAWGSVTNGDTEGATYFGIMTTYTDQSCTGGNEVDTATMALTYKDGELVQLSIAPTLTFVCQGVAAGEDVQPNIDPGGDQTTVASNASGINHGTTVTASVNGRSAHDLEVTTNAGDGYNVYIRHSQQLTNTTSDTIDNHTGTHAAPTSFSSPGTEAWGFTTDDTDITQFDAGEYAGFSTSNLLVATNAGPTTSTETTRVGHQVGISGTTEGGTYQTTILYTMVATY